VKIVEAQGGDPRVVEDTRLMPYATYVRIVEAEREGHISSLDAEKIGLAVLFLGGGRRRKEEEIDRGVGIKLFKKEGDRVYKGEPLAEIWYSSETDLERAFGLVKSAYEISEEFKGRRTLIYERI
ncbi:MAG: pyrimidine-nucleoside phosphorylase, partial [Chloroflexi bacterium]|nr:pyrimidine-nucleoside phosphorylase [Chloroflexota bacterium]